MTKSKYVHSIDVVRFFAALIVVAFHLSFTVWANPKSGGKALISEGYSDGLSSFFWFGWVGVEIFFVISGYVVANSSNGKSALQFLKSRISRLYPAVWICASITLLVLLVTGIYEIEDTIVRYLHSIFLIPIYPWVDPVYWTLAVEISFYALLFLLLLFQKWSRIKTFATILAILAAMYQVPIFIQGIGFDVIVPDLPLQISRLLMLDYGSFFALGIFMWIHQNGNKAVILNIIFTSFICIIELINHANYVYEKIPILKQNSDLIIYFPILVWFISCGMIFAGKKCNFVFEIMGEKIISATRILGLMTFPLYLLHFILGIFIVEKLRLYFGFNTFLSLQLALFPLLYLSYIISVSWEPALRKKLNISIDIFLKFLEKSYSLKSIKKNNVLL